MTPMMRKLITVRMRVSKKKAPKRAPKSAYCVVSGAWGGGKGRPGEGTAGNGETGTGGGDAASGGGTVAGFSGKGGTVAGLGGKGGGIGVEMVIGRLTGLTGEWLQPSSARASSPQPE